MQGMKSSSDGFPARVAAYIRQHRLLRRENRVLLGVSGGVDSVVLLDVLVRLGYPCEVLHLNFGLRAEAAADVAFVHALCKDRRIPFHFEEVDTRSRAHKTGESLQMAARTVRYEAFGRTAKARSIGHTASGHHADDQAETLLLNLMRGTGPEGLAGMRPMRSLEDEIVLIRPLLGETRRTIVDYAKSAELSWHEDASNRDLRFRRVKIRQSIMPHLDVRSLARSAEHLTEWVDQVILPMIDQEFNRAAGERRLSIEMLRDAPPVLARRVILEAIRRWLPGAPATQKLAERIYDLIPLQPGRRVELGVGSVWRNHDMLVFQLSDDSAQHSCQYLDTDSAVEVPDGRLVVSLADHRPASLQSDKGVWLDADRLQMPLEVRPWLPGDRLTPLGMRGSKKVSDVLTDAKVATHWRQRCTVVCSAGEIVWVVGHCLADPFKVTESTCRFARLHIERIARHG